MRRMNLATNKKVTLTKSGVSWVLSLDRMNKRVYWLDGDDAILSSSYNGSNTTNVKSGSFNNLSLGIFKNSVYFQKRNVLYINEMNMTSGHISRNIKVDKADYRDLVIVHNSLQPMGKLQKSF